MQTSMRGSLLLLLGLTAPAAAQLADLQPGRNFPTATAAFGTYVSEAMDLGDIDNDGDLDVAVANGGNANAQMNTLFLDQGGLQGGVQGDFLDVTAERLLGIPADTSRDIDFADVDGDFDLDVLVANRGTTVNGGEVSRSYVNQGGAQLGTIGFFTEGTDAFWGTLVSVPLTDEELPQDGQGPFRAYSCDCDFGDLDDDGALDLFMSGYGPNFQANRDSRLFLNDGAGRFDELWPWADAEADIQLHARDVSLVDLDDDLDLDVFITSQKTQTRLYRNMLAEEGWADSPFVDVTERALVETGATNSGSSTWESAYGDLDGDGDFDFWVVNYDGFTDRILRNDGELQFSKQPGLIRGDPNTDESDADLLDYDGDGDVDVALGNYSGTNWLYQGGLAQGLLPEDGLYHRTGFSSAQSQSIWPETPASVNGGSTLDIEAADVDGDGDHDLLLTNDSNQQNRLWINALGVPDTHAPTLHFVSAQGDTSGPAPTVIHAQVRDNAGDLAVSYYDVRLLYSVGGGPLTCVPMFGQGGQQFRGVIPAIEGAISYRVEVTDDAGNTGVSATYGYVHSAVPAPPVWQLVDCGTEGLYGPPILELSGPQTGGSPLTLVLRDARPGAPFLLWLATPPGAPLSAIGGTVYALPASEQLLLATNSGGMFTAQTTWPAGLPPGIEHVWQCLIADASNPHGLVLSNAVLGTTP